MRTLRGRLTIEHLIVFALSLVTCMHVARGATNVLSEQPKWTSQLRWTSLTLSAYRGDVDGMKAALERGDDINARDIGGATALSEAAGTPNDRVEVIAFLLARGASVNARNDAGETALECACTAGNLKVENPQASES